MKKDTVTQTIAQKTLKIFLGCLILFLVIFALYWCNSKPHPFIKPDTSTLVNKELTLPRGLLPLLETGMNNFRSKMVPTVYIQM